MKEACSGSRENLIPNISSSRENNIQNQNHSKQTQVSEETRLGECLCSKHLIEGNEIVAKDSITVHSECIC